MIAYTHYETDPRVIREAEAAVSAGFDVDFLALRRHEDPPEEMIRGVRVFRLNQRRYRGEGLSSYLLTYLSFFFRCMAAIMARLPRRRYAVIHVNNMPDFLVFCTLPAKLFGSKIILDIHDPMPDTFAAKFKRGEKSLPYRLLLWQELVSASYADAVITVHDPVKDHVLVKHGLPPERVRVVANFADDVLFQLRRTYSVDGTIRLVFHGCILERYGLHTLMKALSKVKHRERIHALIIGEGDYSAQLTHIIHELGLDDVVEFRNRLYPVQDIPGVIAHCNVGLIPLNITSITNYALPLKLLEYISLGLPVVTVRSAAIGYYFSEQDCLFYEPDNEDSLRAVLDRIAETPRILEEYRQRAVAIREKFLWSTEKRKYVRLLHELCGHPPSVSNEA